MNPINKSNFDEITASQKVIVIDVGAAWCGPCRILKPTVLKLEKEFEGRANFYDLDSDSESELCGELKVSAIPTLIFLKSGLRYGFLAGVSSENKIREKIEGMLE